MKNILVTGGAGFIGSNFIHFLFKKSGYEGRVINLDKLTYAGNLDNLTEIENRFGGKRYFFEKADLCDLDKIKEIFQKYHIDAVINFAAESHVDRSILGPEEFIQTNIVGTFNLMEVAREFWQSKDEDKTIFHQVSTDEVYGPTEDGQYCFEYSAYQPTNPYSASKASSDHLVKAYHKTYGLPVTISNSSNNYGPYQFPEKFIPLLILNILEEKPLPLYGDGKNIRDWLYVEDNCTAIWVILNKGKIGEAYNIAGESKWENIKLAHLLCEELALIKGKEKDYYKKLIQYVQDRPGHDQRYAMNCDKIKQTLGWKQAQNFRAGLSKTIQWYLENQNWVDRVKNGEYKKWIEKNYQLR